MIDVRAFPCSVSFEHHQCGQRRREFDVAVAVALDFDVAAEGALAVEPPFPTLQHIDVAVYRESHAQNGTPDHQR